MDGFWWITAHGGVINVTLDYTSAPDDTLTRGHANTCVRAITETHTSLLLCCPAQLASRDAMATVVAENIKEAWEVEDTARVGVCVYVRTCALRWRSRSLKTRYLYVRNGNKRVVFVERCHSSSRSCQGQLGKWKHVSVRRGSLIQFHQKPRRDLLLFFMHRGQKQYLISYDGHHKNTLKCFVAYTFQKHNSNAHIFKFTKMYKCSNIPLLFFREFLWCLWLATVRLQGILITILARTRTTQTYQVL